MPDTKCEYSYEAATVEAGRPGLGSLALNPLEDLDCERPIQDVLLLRGLEEIGGDEKMREQVTGK
jgi:hypothetical protein